MIGPTGEEYWPTDMGGRVDAPRDPHLLLRLAENALGVTEGLRAGYVATTATFVADLKRAMAAADDGRRA